MPRQLQRFSYSINTGKINLPLFTEAGYNVFQKADFLEWHKHEGYELTFVTRGNVIWELGDGTTHHLDIGQASLIMPDTDHRGIHGVTPPCEMAWITFKPNTNALLHTPFTGEEMVRLEKIFAASGNRIVDTTPYMLSLLDELKGICLHREKIYNNNGLDSANLRGILCQMLIHSAFCFEASYMQNEPTDFTAARDYIKHRFTEPINIKDIADHIGRKETYVYNLFKAHAGVTPNEYIQRLRLHFAAEKLRKTDMSITEITFAAGFSSSQYFAKVFSRYMGRSPSAFRSEE